MEKEKDEPKMDLAVKIFLMWFIVMAFMYYIKEIHPNHKSQSGVNKKEIIKE